MTTPEYFILVLVLSLNIFLVSLAIAIYRMVKCIGDMVAYLLDPEGEEEENGEVKQ